MKNRKYVLNHIKRKSSIKPVILTALSLIVYIIFLITLDLALFN